VTACWLATEVTNTRRACWSAAHRNGHDKAWWLPYRYDVHTHAWLRCADKAGPTIMPTTFRTVDEAAAARDELAKTYRFEIVIVHATTGKRLDIRRTVPAGAPICTGSVR
jgi:hypothetical protein